MFSFSILFQKQIFAELQKTIEEFIQTDAVVNPGNSGGALVNTQGDLIGINTAISSPTGVYAGYSFAIPANLVKMVVNEIKELVKVGGPYLVMKDDSQVPVSSRKKDDLMQRLKEIFQL